MIKLEGWCGLRYVWGVCSRWSTHHWREGCRQECDGVADRWGRKESGLRRAMKWKWVSRWAADFWMY